VLEACTLSLHLVLANLVPNSNLQAPHALETIELSLQSLKVLSAHVAAVPSLRMVYGPVMLLITIRALEAAPESVLPTVCDVLAHITAIAPGDAAWERVLHSGIFTLLEQAYV